MPMAMDAFRANAFTSIGTWNHAPFLTWVEAEVAANCKLLFGPQGFDGIKKGRPSGRVIAKADSDQSGEKDRQEHRARADGSCPARQTRDDGRCSDPEQDSNEPAGDRQGYRLHQELGE